MLLSTRASAQALINGYASISYNEDTHVLTGTVTTELDFSAQDWYQGRVIGSIYTEEGDTIAFGAANDVDRDGTVSVTMQATSDSSLGYTAKGINGAIADVRDFNLGAGWYMDYWNFQEVLGREGDVHYVYMPYYGYGPSRSTRTRNIILGSTLAQAGVVGYKDAKLCNATTDFDNTFKPKVTLDAAAAGCTAEDPCSTDPEDRFDVVINFNLPNDAIGMSGTDNSNPGRTKVKTFNELPSENEYGIVGWRYQNINASSRPKRGQMILTLRRRGRGEATIDDRIAVTVAFDYEVSGHETSAIVRVVCP